jgi:hypothetical protein
MALEIYWTQEAIDSFNKIINYLETNWTEREVNGFIDTFKRKLSLLEKDNVIFRNSVKEVTESCSLPNTIGLFIA